MGASPLSLPFRLSLWIASLLSATVLIARAAASALAFTTFADDVRGAVERLALTHSTGTTGTKTGADAGPMRA